MTHPLAQTVYTVPKPPERCGTCTRKAREMRLMAAGLLECSHVDCPHRKRPTAQPRQAAPGI